MFIVVERMVEDMEAKNKFNTVAQIAAIKEPGTYSDQKTRGLYIKCSATGNKAWVYRFQIAGTRREMGLGSVELVSLADARAAAAAAYAKVKEGIDPLDQRNAAKAQEKAAAVKTKLEGVTLQKAMENYIEVRGAAWRSDRHRHEWESTITRHFADLLAMPVSAITVGHVEQSLVKIWTIRTETADRLLGRICNIVDYAAAKGWCATGAAGWDTHLRHVLPSVAPKTKRIVHHKAMAYSSIPSFISTLKDTLPAKALKFLILTAGRSGEVRGATVGEFDLDNAVWCVPATRMKAGKEHKVMLSSQAIELIKPLIESKQSNDLVFEGESMGRPLHDMTVGRCVPDFTVHGFRSSFRDWVAEETDFDTTAAELCLAHATGSAVERAYRRGNMDAKRARIMQAWADFIAP